MKVEDYYNKLNKIVANFEDKNVTKKELNKLFDSIEGTDLENIVKLDVDSLVNALDIQKQNLLMEEEYEESYEASYEESY